MRPNLRKLLFILLPACAGLLFYIWWRIPALADGRPFYQVLFHLQASMAKGEELRNEMLAYGALAPFLFIGLQVLQVIFAPIPGEASGILGGYLFGAGPGFFYSSIGLAIGSWLAFLFGRLLSSLILRKFQGTNVYLQFNHLVSKGDFVIPFILFLLPGFPKDSLSYLLGLSRMPVRIFVFIAAAARMPGTLMLSLQGAQVYQRDYLSLLLLLLASIAVSLPCYLYRKQILARLNSRGRKNNESGSGAS